MRYFVTIYEIELFETQSCINVVTYNMGYNTKQGNLK